MRDYNLHTHTVYCGHGRDLPVDYAEKAIEGGLKVLGFSEHLPFADRRLAKSRMDLSKKPMYLRDIEKAREKYKGQLEIILGWECDYFTDMIGYYEELKGETDYLTFGTHFLYFDGEYHTVFDHDLTKKMLGMYADNIIAGMSSGFFEFVAHPDVFFFGWKEWDSEAKAVSKAIIEAAIDLGMPMELNGNGLIRETPYNRPVYPMPDFWRLACDMGAKYFLANTDAHKAEHVAYALPKMDEFIKPYGIELLELESIRPLKFRMER